MNQCVNTRWWLYLPKFSPTLTLPSLQLYNRSHCTASVTQLHLSRHIANVFSALFRPFRFYCSAKTEWNNPYGWSCSDFVNWLALTGWNASAVAVLFDLWCNWSNRSVAMVKNLCEMCNRSLIVTIWFFDESDCKLSAI